MNIQPLYSSPQGARQKSSDLKGHSMCSKFIPMSSSVTRAPLNLTCWRQSQKPSRIWPKRSGSATWRYDALLMTKRGNLSGLEPLCVPKHDQVSRQFAPTNIQRVLMHGHRCHQQKRADRKVPLAYRSHATKNEVDLLRNLSSQRLDGLTPDLFLRVEGVK